jgi:phenylpyruvate tautomerase PptA (4-oxalocrotonate tautomerase family)
MPLAKIYLLEGRYDEARITKVSAAVQSALISTLRVPPEDFYQLIFEMPKNRLLHTPAFVGMHYTDDLIILDLTFIQGRSKETRLALLKDINTRVAAAAHVSPDDMLITLYEVPGENISFGQGEAQRANAVARTWDWCRGRPSPDRQEAIFLTYRALNCGSFRLGPGRGERGFLSRSVTAARVSCLTSKRGAP